MKSDNESAKVQGFSHEQQSQKRLGIHPVGDSVRRALGNQCLLRSKLNLGRTDDPGEREADHFADRVLANHKLGSVSGVDAPRTQPRFNAIERDQAFSVQAKSNAPVASNPAVAVALPNSSGERLSEPTNQFFSQRFGQDFSTVRSHTDGNAAHSARAINAKAFTVGQHIVFGRGQYAPDTKNGKHLLAHELTHTLQQKQFKQTNLIQRNEDATSNNSTNNAANNPPHGIEWNPLELLAYPLSIDIWNDIANHRVDQATLDKIRLQGTEAAALWNAV
jgi:hypothetical protein